VSLSDVPSRVRAHIYLYYAGAGIGVLGLIGFILSFGQVGSSAQATVDVHTDVPVFAYASIALWLVGLGAMWYSRRTLNAALREKMKQDRTAALGGAVVNLDAAEGADPPGA
jgi:hypothetical protein